MPIIASAKKRVRVAARATARNRQTKRIMRNAIKAFEAAVASGDAKKITSAQAEAQSALDTAVKKNIIHKNKAARKKAALAQVARNNSAKKPATRAVKNTKPTSKTVPKKPATKKASTQKTTIKK